MNRIVIRLYDMVGTGVVIPSKTGVYYSNQTGGTGCLQPEVEGFLIPVFNDISVPEFWLVSPERDLERHFTGDFWNGTG